jgi:hypothetical protein
MERNIAGDQWTQPEDERAGRNGNPTDLKLLRGGVAERPLQPQELNEANACGVKHIEGF